MVKEYRFRKLFGLSREDYLSEPRMNVEWLLSIDNVFREAEHGD